MMAPLDDHAAKKKRTYEIAKMILIVVCTISSMAILSIMLLAVAKLQQVTASTNENSRILIDCTSPKGKCFQEGNKRTAGVVGTINQVSIYAAYCSKIPENDTVKEIEACINKELDK